MRFQLLLAYVLFNVYSHELSHELIGALSESLYNGSSLVKEEVSHHIESDVLASNNDDFLPSNNDDFLASKSDVKSSDLVFNKSPSAIATTFIKNPASFVEAFAKADPGQISEIITLLETLADESISQKKDLETRQQSADTDHTSAREALDLADQHKVNTAAALQEAETADNDAQVALNTATNQEQLAQVVLDDANANLESQGPVLDSEVATVNQVIEMLEAIYVPETVYEVGSCQPTGDYTPNECCPYGYSSIESWEDCTKAFAALTSSSLAGTATGREDSWSNRPSGCFWHQPNNHVYYNNLNNDQIVSELAGDDKVVCEVNDVHYYKVGTCQPTGGYTPNECCPNGYSSIESWEDCTKAFEVLTPSSLAGTATGREDSWPNRPSGCFWHQPNNHVYYNNYNNDQIVSELAGDDKVVCHLGV